MSKRSIEDKFSIDIDAYFKGIEDSNNLNSKEYKDILQLGKNLADNDFSKNSNKEDIFKKVSINIDENRGDNSMKKSNKIKRSAIAAAVVCVMGISLIQSSYAQDLVEKVINIISVGHINAVEVESSIEETFPVPQELKGKIFDEDGNPIEVATKENDGKCYTADGELIVEILDGEIITEAEQEKMDKEGKLIVNDSKNVNKYTCFKVIIPSYIPEGYEFDRAEFYKDDNGVVSNTKYINLYFMNMKTGKEIFMQQRFADEETGFTMSTDGKIQKVKVNGEDAIISDDRNIDWEFNGVIYCLSGKGEITKSELIKIAESIK